MSNTNTVERIFAPEAINNYFVELTKVAHPSRKEDPIRKWLIDQVKGICAKFSDNRTNIEIVQYKQDAVNPGERNIVLSRAGSGEFASNEPIILQAHLDMVTVPTEDIYPLKLETYKKDGNTWLTAKETTLGADDGIGIATILAFLEDPEMKDVPIECLFTVQEEVDMGGAKGLDIHNLNGRSFINLDAEDLTTIIYGSAGGCETKISGKVKLEDSSRKVCMAVSLSGLKSGHSGIDIDKGRVNAITTLAEMLIRLNRRLNNFENGQGVNTYDLLVSEIRRADTVKSNSIPAAAEAVVCLPAIQSEGFKADFLKLAMLVKEQNLPVENTAVYDVQPILCTDCLPMASTDALLLLLGRLPNGVVRMIDSNPTLVETSSNLYNVERSGEDVSIYISNRSSAKNSLENLMEIQTITGNLYGYEVNTNLDAYPSWQPNEDSDLLQIAKKVYTNEYGGQNIHATVIHAGLECSWMIEKYDGVMDCISIGPTIENPHTVDESLEIEINGKPALVDFYKAVKEIVLETVQLSKTHLQERKEMSK